MGNIGGQQMKQCGTLELDFDAVEDIRQSINEKVKLHITGKTFSSVDKNKAIAVLTKRLETGLKKAESISTDIHGNYTNKRANEAAHRAKEKERLNNWCRILKRLITEWEQGTIKPELSKIRSLTDIELIQWGKYPEPPTSEHGDWYHKEYPDKLKKFQSLGITSYEQQQDISLTLDQYGAAYISPEDQRQINLSNKIKEFRGMKIPGFFPTPEGLINEMFLYADVQDGMSCLEPSAGFGNIPDFAKEHGYTNDWVCIEVNFNLHEILLLKGYTAFCNDILQLEASKLYDRIVMNPPFEKGQDVEHVTHCFNTFLKPGGKLVSIMSNGVQSNQQNKFKAFRELVDKHGIFVDVPAGSFKDSFNPTGVSVCICVLNK